MEDKIAKLREMIAESDSFIIGTHYDIHKVILTLIIATVSVAIPFSLLEFQSHLIVAITYFRTFAIYRLPCCIRLSLFSPCQFQIFTPKMTSIVRNAQRRLKQLILNQNS